MCAALVHVPEVSDDDAATLYPVRDAAVDVIDVVARDV